MRLLGPMPCAHMLHCSRSGSVNTVALAALTNIGAPELRPAFVSLWRI
jgi:hypothetical protein